jgi:hypothetical protein
MGNWMRAALIAATVVAWSGDVGAVGCPGDCDGNLEVMAEELRLATEIALGQALPGDCTAVGTGGEVTVADLVVAVLGKLNGCPGAPTRTPTSTARSTSTPTPTATPTSAAATPTATANGTVLPGCDNGSWSLSYSNASATNAVTTGVDLGVVGATQTGPLNGRYNWILLGSECAEGVRFHRGMQLQVILQTSPIAPGTYALNPPFGNLLYQEIQDPQVFIRSWANTSGGTLTIDSVEGNGFHFHLSAPMVPSTIVSLNSVPEGTFTLEVSGEVKNIIRP